LEISLSFLNEGTYQTTIYSDAADTDLHPENLDVTEKEMKNTETIKVKLAHGGGLAVHFRKSE
jgi:alpha-glucosidase